MKIHTHQLRTFLLLMIVAVPGLASAADCYGTYEVSWRTSETHGTHFSEFTRAGKFPDSGDCKGHDAALNLAKELESKEHVVRFVRRFMGSATVLFESSTNPILFGRRQVAKASELVAKATDKPVVVAATTQPKAARRPLSKMRRKLLRLRACERGDMIRCRTGI